MGKITTLILAILLLFALVSCQQPPAAPVTPDAPDSTATAAPAATDKPNAGLIGIAMPDKNNNYRHWERDGKEIKEQLEAKGYTVELMYAVNDVATQENQIRELITDGCKVLVIAAVDYNVMDSVLAETKASGVTVIAYDRPLLGTVNVDYFVTFDIFRYGALQGEYIEDKLGLKYGKGPFNIEVFAGDISDANMMFYYEGGMSILRPYIESGQLVVKSGQTDWMDTYTDLYKSENAKTRMDGLLAEYYTNDKPDAVFALNDSIAMGVITSLEDAGYTEFPIITGMGCEKLNVMAMKAGKQSMSVFQDTRILATKVVEMADAVMTGKKVPHTAAEHHSNGIDFYVGYCGEKAVPTFLCDAAVVTADNIQEILIDGGYYTEADLEG